MRKSLLPILLALLGGAAGFGLRKWQLAAGFEPGTGLPISHPSALALICLSAAVAAALGAMNWGKKERMPWDRAFFGARGNTLFITACVLAGFLLLAGAGVEAVSLSGTYRSAGASGTKVAKAVLTALPPLRLALGLCGLPCVLGWCQNLYRGGEKGRESLCLLELCFLFCVWLVSDYQSMAADPVVEGYAYKVLAITCTLLGLYNIAGYSFQEGKPRRTLFFCLMGAYFCIVTLADKHSLGDLFRCGFAILFLTAHAALILGEHPAEMPLAEIETEADPNG